MFKILGISVLGLVLATMGGCSKNNAILTDIVTDAQKVCKFAPSVESVVSLLAANPAIATAEQAVTLICDGLNSWQANQPPPSGNLGAPLNKRVQFHLFVNGKPVVITGHKI